MQYQHTLTYQPIETNQEIYRKYTEKNRNRKNAIMNPPLFLREREQNKMKMCIMPRGVPTKWRLLNLVTRLPA